MPFYSVNNIKPVIGENTWIAPSAEIIGDVRIGNNCYIGFSAVLRGDYGTIIIGDGSAIEEGVIIHARPLDKTEIGLHVTIGHMAMIHNAVIRDYAVIGMQAMISDFSEVGEWAIVAEKSLVKRKQIVPPGKIYAGAPAVEKGDVTERHRFEWEMGKKVYSDLAGRYSHEVKEINEEDIPGYGTSS